MKHFFILVSILTFSGYLFAQTPAAQVQMSEEIRSQRTNQVSLDISLLQSLALGFAVELPAETMAALTEVKVGNESLWLKKDASIPQTANTIHWTEQENQIVILFVANTLNTGQNIQLSLQVFQQANIQGTSELRINRIDSSEEGTYDAGSEISRVQIFQTNNTETR